MGPDDLQLEDFKQRLADGAIVLEMTEAARELVARGRTSARSMAPEFKALPVVRYDIEDPPAP